jgi:two-component system, cell cycle sensor histidine kinase and response regulator CckA
MEGVTDGPGRGTILLVEDEEGVRSVLSELLTGLGYTVLQAANGVEAVGIATKHVDVIDLVVTDMVMPEMSGQELGRNLANQWPNLRILYMSAFASKIYSPSALANALADFISKPFDLEDFVVKVRELMAQSPPADGGRAAAGSSAG